MALTIPARHKPILGQLLQLRSEDRAALLEALRRLKVTTLDVGRLAKEIQADTGLDLEQAEQVLSMLMSMYAIPYTSSVDRSKVPADLVEAVEKEKSLAASAEDLSAFRAFIEDALALDSTLGVISKAALLTTGNERLYCTAKIFSDLRPVFGDDIDEPLAFVGSHVLRLTYHLTDFSTEDIYITFGHDDLARLSDVIKRAQEKEGSLRGAAERFGVRYLVTGDQC